MSAVVAIIGRPNVGKSTLFNRLSRSRNSLVVDKPGVTRDRLYANVRWDDTSFTLIDTGGYEDLGQDPLQNKVREHVEKAITEADHIIFMVDGKQGLMPGDEVMAHSLRTANKKFFLAVNKIDGPEHEDKATEFYMLGIETLYAFSAAHGYGLRDLMTAVIKEIRVPAPPDKESHAIRVSIVGRPNVGKSSLINRIIGFDRLLVSELPGTTRDSIDILFTRKGNEFLFIDTAGLRRKGRVKDKIDTFSMIKSIKSIERCHIAVVLLDADAGVMEQDARICGYALEKGKGLVLGVNKWDLIRKDQERKRSLNGAIEQKLQFITFAPRINVSALTGEGVKKLFEKIQLVYDHYTRRITTGAVNRTIMELIRKHPPPRKGRTQLKLYYATQTAVRPPTVVVFVNRPDLIHFSYERYIINQLREKLNLKHTPIRLLFRKKRSD